MDSYDSDSSLEDEDVTETNVLLGYASKEQTSDSISYLGGYPTWLDDRTAPSGDLAKCKVCNSLMSLVLQLNGDLPSRFPDHERRLYLFICRRKPCRRKEGSVRGLRGNRFTRSVKITETNSDVEELSSKDANPTDIGATLFGVSSTSVPTTANPFSVPSAASSALANPFASTSSLAAKPAQKPTDTATGLSETFASKARISASSTTDTNIASFSHEPWPSQSAFPRPFSLYFLDAEYEALDAPISIEIPNQARLDSDTEAGMSANGNSEGMAEDKQLFESSMDKTFQQFADRLAQNPEQVLRYEFGGQPLLYSATDVVGTLLDPHSSALKTGKVNTVSSTTNGASALRIPRCPNCGCKRVFEVQLVPHAITVLEDDEDVGLDGMDWGTIILGVCENDCSPRGCAEGEVGYLEEWVGVQWEELMARKGA